MCSAQIFLSVRQRRKLPAIAKQSDFNSLDLLHQHTLASVAIAQGDESSGSSELGPDKHNMPLPDGCVKAVEALCDKFK